MTAEPICLFLSADDIVWLTSQGWTVLGGPFSTIFECMANCGQPPPSSVSASSTSCCNLCQEVPLDWTLTIASGTGVFAPAVGTWTITDIIGYNGCDPTDPSTWEFTTPADAQGNYCVIIVDASAKCSPGNTTGASGLSVYINSYNSSGAVIGNEQFAIYFDNLNQAPCCDDHTLFYIGGFTPPGSTPASHVDLEGNCTSSSQSSTSVCCTVCQTPPKNWTAVITGGTGDFSVANGTWTITQVDGYTFCNPTDPSEWIFETPPDAQGNRAVIFIDVGATCVPGVATTEIDVTIDILNSAGRIIGNADYKLTFMLSQAPCCGNNTIPYVGGNNPPASTPPGPVALTGNC